VLPRLRKVPVDLVILDLMLPGMDGLIVCQAMRADPTLASIPIIMLTAKAEESDRISGLELGADDYVTKPFSPKELTARVAALLRRSGRPTTSGLLRYGSITIDADRHHVALDGEDVRLTAKEFLLLQYLLQHRGRVLSRDLLLSDVWGYQYTGGTRTVDVHIRRLREKLPPLAGAIETIKPSSRSRSYPRGSGRPRPTASSGPSSTKRGWPPRLYRIACLLGPRSWTLKLTRLAGSSARA